MMLVVIPHVIRKGVQRSIIRIRLLLKAVPEVMLRNEVAGARVQAPGKEA